MDHEREERSPDQSGQGVWERLNHFIESNRHLAWALISLGGLVVFWQVLPAHDRLALEHRLVSQRYLVSMLVFLSLLVLSLLWSAGQDLDALVFLYFNLHGHRPQWLDRFMLGLTQLGSGLTGFILAAIFFFLQNHRLAYEIILGTLTLWLLVELVKAIIRRARPFVLLAQARIVGWRARGRSFPSGHTSQSFFLVTFLVQYFHLSLGGAAWLYLLALVVGITRMYVGAHYPRDVMAGAILGTVWGVLGGIVDGHLFIGK